ncbi:MAG: ShlB/FhaC/HecB family hemolysin secretion/activation protein [Pelosinus sp.]|nr:ShlB/FhaC/HecB family hemolysin secretion/activation protein [Pelosinus sp.]
MRTFQHTTQLLTISALSMALCIPVMAAPITRPDTGSILREQQDKSLPTPEKQGSGIEVSGQRQETVSNVGGPKIQVKSIHISGQSIYSQDKLLALISGGIGQKLTLGELQNLAGRITKYFRDQGYLVANAYIPEQDSKDGAVDIVVIVGQYGKIDLRNNSTLKEQMVLSLVSDLKSGDYIKNDKLEQTLLLLNDTYGVSAKAMLAPGKEVGTADLIIDISNTVKVSGHVSTDNWGNRFTGEKQFGLGVNINNPGGVGDMINIGGAYTGSGMNDYSLSYVLPTGGHGAKLGVGYSQMHYSLGEEFSSSNANGIAKTTSIFETFALKRSRQFNLNGKIQYDSKLLIDRVDAATYDSEKRANVLTVGISGNGSDQFGGGGMNGFAFTYAFGHLGLRSADAVSTDANAQAAGSYSKTNLNLSRIQAINSRVNLYLSFEGQLANKNLDSSEKLQIGGPSGVRAYPVGEAPSDEGYIFTGEFRWNMPTPNFQLAAFYDSGKAKINKSTWAGAGVNDRDLSGAGLGLIWNRANDYSIRLDYAWKISSDPASADNDKSGRLWLQGVKYF